MDNRPNPGAQAGLAEQIGAAFAWWREAGVDCDYHDDAQSWLARDEPEPDFAPITAPAKREEPAAPAIAREALPEDLSAFAPWWLAEPSLDGGRTVDRVPPRGSRRARLMVLVPHPEREDREHLLAGPQGRLLDSLLAAAGIAPDHAYVAAALPRHTPHADWPGIAAQGMDAILARHVSLVAPERLIVFGSNILPLLSHDPAKNPDDLEQFNHESGTVPLLLARDLAMLLERPSWKSQVWSRWLEWAPPV